MLSNGAVSKTLYCHVQGVPAADVEQLQNSFCKYSILPVERTHEWRSSYSPACKAASARPVLTKETSYGNVRLFKHARACSDSDDNIFLCWSKQTDTSMFRLQRLMRGADNVLGMV